jgi:pyruvate formate lyase activating enzyme
MEIKIFQTGWNYSQDGPGNRLLYHFQGCNFTCPWCSNPEGCPPEGVLFIRSELLRPEVCPRGAVSREGLDRRICETCSGRECLTVHRNQGIRFSCKSYSTEELIRQAVESKPLFFDGGGVTVTGGEATLQFRALKELLRGLKAEGIHTALETNGSHAGLCDLLPDLDLLILDLKHWDFEKARSVIGNRAAHVWDNLKKACESGTKVLARITVIPGFNDSEEDMVEFACRLHSYAGLENFRFELLYYHQYGREKWEAIGKDYNGPEDGISEESKSIIGGIFEGRGIPVASS